MQSLRTLQSKFLDAVFRTDASDVLAYIKPGAKVAPSAQFNIYKNNIFSGMSKALKNIYPVCYQLVGNDFFVGMAHHYIHESPSTSPDLNLYGKEFAAFISAFEPAKSLLYLADVARLEWAWHRVYTAPDTAPFPFEKFAEKFASGPENIIFNLPPASTLLYSPYPIHQIWEANYKNASPENIITLLPDQTFYFFIWRKEFESRIECLTQSQWQLLSLIEKKFTLESLCDQASSFEPPIAMENSLPELINKQWITDFQ